MCVGPVTDDPFPVHVKIVFLHQAWYNLADNDNPISIWLLLLEMTVFETSSYRLYRHKATALIDGKKCLQDYSISQIFSNLSLYPVAGKSCMTTLVVIDILLP